MSEEKAAYRPRVLCLRPEASADLPAGLAPHLEATLVHRLSAAMDCALDMSYECHLAYCGADAATAVDFWSSVRAVDRNTPFVIVGDAATFDVLEKRLRAGYDIFVTAPSNAYDILLLISCLHDDAELRSLHARAEEARVVADDIRLRLSATEQRMISASASLARAQSHLVRARALTAFVQAGGAPAFFERYWPDTLSSALREIQDGRC
jgi:hypothetical protein